MNSYSISFNIQNLKVLPNVSVIRYFIYSSTKNLAVEFIVVVFIALHQRTLNLYIFEPSDGCTSSCIYSENLVEATQNQTEEEGILLLLLQAFTSTSTRILWQ